MSGSAGDFWGFEHQREFPFSGRYKFVPEQQANQAPKAKVEVVIRRPVVTIEHQQQDLGCPHREELKRDQARLQTCDL